MARKKKAALPVDPCRGRDAESIRQDFANHLKYVLAKDKYSATDHDRYLALAQTIRDRLVERWIATQQTHHKQHVKRVYYLSLEFLLGRSICNNIINLGIADAVYEAAESLGFDWARLRDQEVDAALGNGGLGRLAACYLDSLATMEIPAMGYGLRYDYGIFRQRFENGRQVEDPDDWLRLGNPWEMQRPEFRFRVHFGGRVLMDHSNGSLTVRWIDTRPVIGIPYDIPIVGYGGKTVNNLRLWSARAAEEFDFEDFNQGDYVAAVASKVTAENLTKVLYPNDNVYQGKELRLRQQYFFVSCTLQDIFRRFKADHDDLTKFPEKVAIQINDTHPALAIAEMMRLLVDEERLPWEVAWTLTVQTFGYTNHTLLSEALETWPVDMIERLLPRLLQIIYEINRRFLNDVQTRFGNDIDRIRRMSLIDEGPPKRVRMAHLAVVGSHATNGVAKLHTELLKRRLLPDFAEMFPERFSNKTNGISPRRWLLTCNRPLAQLITDAIGDSWITDLAQLKRLRPFADDADFRRRFRQAKQQAKASLADWMLKTYKLAAAPDSLFDVHIKRIHEYKRQLLNAMHIVWLYRQLHNQPDQDFVPRTFIFAGKAAPGYKMARRIIKLINNLAQMVNHDPVVNDRIKVCFLPDYSVSLAERIIPAADVSEQISQAGTEASGTGNMKLMLNGALTVGTLDGANIEILEAVGAQNMFMFGLDSSQVAELAPRYNPRELYQRDGELRATVDLMFSGHFNCGEPGIFDAIRIMLLDEGDRYMVLADLRSYVEAQARAGELYRHREEWVRRAVLNVAAAGRFSSDRAIAEYLRDIWHAARCPVEIEDETPEDVIADVGGKRARV